MCEILSQKKIKNLKSSSINSFLYVITKSELYLVFPFLESPKTLQTSSHFYSQTIDSGLVLPREKQLALENLY